MSDDWLHHGHEMDGVELTPVLSSSGALDGRAAAPSTPRWTSGWRGLIVGGAIALLATLGIVGVANAISDNLFPSMGSARPSSVWLNPVPPTEPAATTTPTTPTSATSTPTATAPATVPPATAATAPNTANTTALVPSTSASTGEDDDRGGNGGDDEPDEPDEPDDSDSSGRSSSGSGRDDDRDDRDDSDDNVED